MCISKKPLKANYLKIKSVFIKKLALIINNLKVCGLLKVKGM
jgi:hypothetical protein